MSTIYNRAIKVLYGTVDAAKLFYDNLCGVLVNELGFKLNSYDGCVADKIIDGKQCMIVFHADDLKISHVNQDVVTGIINKLNSKYGEIIPLSTSREKYMTA